MVEVEVRHDGVSGFGEAAPIERYDESAGVGARVPRGRRRAARRRSVRARRDRGAAAGPASRRRKAAIDAALHDLQGKLVGLPVWRLLGLRRAGPPTSWTIWLGDPDDMARRAEKVARPVQAAEAEARRRATGSTSSACARCAASTDLPLQVRRQRGLDARRGARGPAAAAELGVEYCEQPLPAGDPDGPELKRRSPLPIYVDEDCHTLADVAACAERAHGINIKLAKSGGIREAVRMAHAGARARARRDARLHGRVGARRSPPARTSRACSTTSTSTATCCSPTTRGPASSSSTASSFPPNAPGLGVRAARRLLILAEGRSGDPHYGKTARGVIRYAPDDVVAILDSTRARRDATTAFPVVAHGRRRRCATSRRPRSSASRPRAAASRRRGASC